MKTLINIVALTVLSSLTLGKVYAQQDPLYSQYFWNKLIVNPAYAGSNETMNATLIAREQWIGIDGRPSTQSFTFQTPLKNEAISLGMDVTHDKLGPSETTTVNGDFAYRFKLTETSKLAFGVKAGLDLWKADLEGIGQEGDPLFMSNITTTPLPNFGAGIWWHSQKHFVGLSTPRLLEKELDKSGNTTEQGEIRRHYYLMAGYVFELNPIIKFKPTGLFRMEEGGVNSFDIGANFMFVDRLWVGAAYRDSESAGINASYSIQDFFRIGYAYDFQIGGLSGYNSGSHEIMMSYDFSFKKHNLMTPRYF